MTTTHKTWFALSKPNDRLILCAACTQPIDGEPGDHHPRVCPNCGIESLFVDWNDSVIQITPSTAPPALRLMIQLAQENLDELEFTELLCHLEELAAAVIARSKFDQLGVNEQNHE